MQSLIQIAAVCISTVIAVMMLVQLARRRSGMTAVGRTQNEVHSINTQMLDLAMDGAIVADIRQVDMPVTYVNRAFQEISGYTAAEVIGKNLRYLQGNDRQQPEISEVREAIKNRVSVSVTMRNYRKDGRMFWTELRLAPVFDTLGTATHYIGVMRDVTGLKDAASKLEHAADQDPLSLVMNRSSFRDRLDALLQAYEEAHILVATVDIARFHEINVSYGYELGDALLIQLAHRLRRLPNTLVGRLGANEFGVAVHLANSDATETFIAELSAVLAPNFVLPGTTIDVGYSIGFTVGETGDEALVLLKQAGVALHESRSSRLREVRRFESKTDLEIRKRVRLKSELFQAVANNEFILHYQPKVELATGTIVGAEALVRWRHPVYGLQLPGQFISVAEDTGLIIDIGAWVLRTAAAFAVEVNRNRALALTFSVNVSQLQFTQRDMVQLVRTVLDETGAEASWLVLELTESLLVDHSPEMIASFRELRGMGVGLSIDDFGTGYSSLQYLESFPLSEIKIDRSFIKDLHQSGFFRLIADAVIKFGKELQVDVTAEGIETESERELLKEMGCPYGQGYLFGRPIERDEFVRLVMHHSVLPVGSNRRSATGNCLPTIGAGKAAADRIHLVVSPAPLQVAL